LLLGFAAGPIARRAAQSLFEELVDFLDDSLNLDAQAQQQSAHALRGRGYEIHFLADVARSVGVGDILANDLQAQSALPAASCWQVGSS
jgi:hypothetical protein